MDRKHILWVVLASLFVGTAYQRDSYLVERDELKESVEALKTVAVALADKANDCHDTVDELYSETNCIGKLAKCNEGYNGQIDVSMIAMENTDEMRGIAETCLGRELQDSDFTEDL